MRFHGRSKLPEWFKRVRYRTQRMWLKRSLGVLLLVGGWYGTVVPASADGLAPIVVSPGGDDRNSGTETLPLRSLERAQAMARARAVKMTDDVVVLLRGGLYELERELEFDARDSGTNGFRVIYRSFPGERAVLSGGRKVVGWTLGENGIAQADVTGLTFRQLYVGGRRATRARWPNAPEYVRLTRWDEELQRLVLSAERVPAAAVLDSAVELIVFKQWTQDILRIAAVTEQNGEVSVAAREPDRTHAFAGHAFLRLEGQAAYFENALSFLDAPGEWYLQREAGRLWYRPRPGEDLLRVPVVAPGLERLIEIRGTAGDPVHDLSFEGLMLEHAGWNGPTEEGFTTMQADVRFGNGSPMGGRVQAAVQVEHAHHVRFEGNRFEHLGGTALALVTDVTHSEVVGNRFSDLSGGGIVVDSLLEMRPLDPRLRCADILVANNRIEAIGLDYRSSVAIFAGVVARTRIEHNEIADVPYTGISVGWGWTDEDTPLGHNVIAANHIERAMGFMADGGGIYTLSRQPGTVVTENYVHDLVRSPWAGHSPIPGIYLDEGSSQLLVANNVLEQVPLGILFHRASHNRAVNTEGTIEEHNQATDNLVGTEPGFDPEQVKARAGLEAQFTPLRTEQ